jgi:hypothetical protein
MIGTHFFTDDKNFSATEFPCADEVRAAADLAVPLPDFNHDFQTLAHFLARSLPRQGPLPETKDAALTWQNATRATLRNVVRYHRYDVQPYEIARDKADVPAIAWSLKVGGTWSVPVVELRPARPKGTVVILSEKGRVGAAAGAKEWLAKDQRVLLVDPFYLGENALGRQAYLWALLVGSVGERPLGVQASQVAAVARWAKATGEPVHIVAQDELTGLIALVAAALEPDAISGVELRQTLASLKEVIERNLTFPQRPEYFCFGLLEHVDILHLAALTAPRPVRLGTLTERQRREFATLAAWYRTLGAAWNEK